LTNRFINLNECVLLSQATISHFGPFLGWITVRQHDCVCTWNRSW